MNNHELRALQKLRGTWWCPCRLQLAPNADSKTALKTQNAAFKSDESKNHPEPSHQKCKAGPQSKKSRVTFMTPSTPGECGRVLNLSWMTGPPPQCDSNTVFLSVLNSYFGQFDAPNNTPTTKVPLHQDDQILSLNPADVHWTLRRVCPQEAAGPVCTIGPIAQRVCKPTSSCPHGHI